MGKTTSVEGDEKVRTVATAHLDSPSHWTPGFQEALYQEHPNTMRHFASHGAHQLRDLGQVILPL